MLYGILLKRSIIPETEKTLLNQYSIDWLLYNELYSVNHKTLDMLQRIEKKSLKFFKVIYFNQNLLYFKKIKIVLLV